MKSYFPEQFRKIIKRYKNLVYNMNVIRQTACLVFYPITIDSYTSLFHCATVGPVSDFMTVLT